LCDEITAFSTSTHVLFCEQKPPAELNKRSLATLVSGEDRYRLAVVVSNGNRVTFHATIPAAQTDVVDTVHRDISEVRLH